MHLVICLILLIIPCNFYRQINESSESAVYEMGSATSYLIDAWDYAGTIAPLVVGVGLCIYFGPEVGWLGFEMSTHLVDQIETRWINVAKNGTVVEQFAVTDKHQIADIVEANKGRIMATYS